MRNSVIFVIMTLFGVYSVVRFGGLLSALPTEEIIVDVVETTGDFATYDAWQEELESRERDVEALWVATDIALQEARRHAARAEQSEERHAEDRRRGRRLASVYGTMAPDRAARSLAGLPSAQGAMIIAEMDPDRAGTILEALPPEAAHAITTELLGEALAPEAVSSETDA